MNENSKKIVIVGSGLGGLFSGALLAKNGHQVTVIEGHYNVGGYASSFKRGKSIHEVAIHCLDGFSPDSEKIVGFKELEILDNVTFVRTPEFYVFRIGKKSLTIPDNTDLALAALKKYYPEDSEGLDEFFYVIKNVEKEINNYKDRDKGEDDPFLFLRYPLIGKYSGLTVSGFLESRMSNLELKLLLMANIQFYHDDPLELDFLSYAYGNSYYFNYGQFFIKGSSQSLGDYLKNYITSRNGQFLMGTLANGVELDGDLITAIKTFKRSSEEKSVVSGDVFIFNNPPTEVERWVNRTELLSIGPFKEKKFSKSACTLYLEFDVPPASFGHNGYVNYFFLPNNKGKGPLYTGFGFIDYSQIDSDLNRGGKSIASIVFMADYEDWFELSSEEYGAKKKIMINELLDHLDEKYPGMKATCSKAELATPLTMERYTYNPNGAVYAFSPTSKNALTEELIKNNIHNAYFASAWAGAPGFSGSSTSGINTANKIVKKYGSAKK